MPIKDEDVLDRYLDATEESAKRVRQSVISALVGSVIIFAAIWNNRPGNWSHYQLSVLIQERSAAQARLQFLEAVSKGAPAPPNSIEAAAQEIAVQRQKATLDDFDGMIKKVQGDVLESYSVKVPFFGVAFHLNDAGLIGCLSLIVLGTLVASSVRRLLHTLTILFDEARGQDCLGRCYYIASMSQVLTTVPTKFEPYWGFARHLPKVLFAGPVVTGGFVLWVDWQTWDAVPYEVFVQRMAFTSVFVSVVFVLTASAVLSSLRVDALWAATARDLGILDSAAAQTDPETPSQTPTPESDHSERPAAVAATSNIPQIPVVTETPPAKIGLVPVPPGSEAEPTPQVLDDRDPNR